MRRPETYSLRQVADLTGLSEFTLRGWEGRYQAFEPDRTKTGRRRYSKKDLKKAFLLRELTNAGHRIGEIAKLQNAVLEKKLSNPALSDAPASHKPDENIENLLKLVLLQNWDELKKILSQLIVRKSPLVAIEKIILPILARFGEYVATERVGIAQEHILSSLIKEQLYYLLSKATKNSPLHQHFSVVIATPDGDFHEIGILISHVLFNANGVRSLYLGPNTPKNELCETALQFGATHILLSSALNRNNGAQEEIYSYLHYVDQHLPKSVNLWVGGRGLDMLNLKLIRNFKVLRSLQELPQYIKESL